MANRHKAQKAKGSRSVYEGAGSNVVHEADQFKGGGHTSHHPEHVNGHKGKHRLDKRARGGGHFIKGAIRYPGSLHRALHVPQGKKIPAAKLNKAAHSDNLKLKRKAVLAKTLKGFH